jgi:S1-C subfamily serine protease/Tfp pilus assembly protein PilF
MSTLRSLLALALVLAATGPARSQERDLRELYGARTLEAAKLLQQAAQALDTSKFKDALRHADAAAKQEPNCQRAYFIKALASGRLGDVEGAIEAYKTCLSDKVLPYPHFSAMAANNLAVTYGKLKEYEQANIWFTRAILEDYANRFKERGKAYRNLAITLRNQGRHMAAALAVMHAYEDKAANTDVKMVRDFLAKAEEDEGASMLHFPEPLPQLDKRTQETKLAPVSLDGGPTEAIADLLTDPQGRYVIALPVRAPHYYVLNTTDKLSARKVAVTNPLRCACLAGGHLYAAADEPSRIVKIEPETGKVLATHLLKTAAPTSLAVFPVQGRAWFPIGRDLHELNLRTGALAKTDVPGQVIVGDPSQRFLYSYVKPDIRRSGGVVIIRGRPVRWRSTGGGSLQTTLFKAVVTPGGLLLAEARGNAASNGNRLSISPDGNWVAIAGGGGWRPETKPAPPAGYGVAVFCAGRLEKVQGFFASGPYPSGVCFNPVTGQVAVVRGQDVHVYHLADPKNGVELKGAFTGPAAWSGNGRYLILAVANGVTIYDNALSSGEQKLAGAWWKAIKVARATVPAVRPATFRAVEELTRFALAALKREDVAGAFDKAASAGRTERLGQWPEYAPYVKDPKPRQAIDAAAPQFNSKEDIGIAIFQLKKALKNNPDSVPLQFVLAQAYRLGNQPEEAEKLYLAVVRADAGRTTLSCLSLNFLAALLDARGESLTALNCLATSLSLDRANPQTLGLSISLLKKHKFEPEAQKLAKLVTIVRPLVTDLPKLPKPGASKKLAASEIYGKAVVSVVLIKTRSGSGSGVCVGRPDIIMTNAHVVGTYTAVDVYPFTLKGKTPERLPRVTGTVIFKSDKQDIAVLRLEKAPEHLKPLPVAVANPGPGDKVYALGSPGTTGGEVLEQTISEGLVSSTNRNVEGVRYLQHSAAVNPGNSGGALLDEQCHVVGLVTLKARLENVSFALPAETIRTIFNSR